MRIAKIMPHVWVHGLWFTVQVLRNIFVNAFRAKITQVVHTCTYRILSPKPLGQYEAVWVPTPTVSREGPETDLFAYLAV